MALHSDESFSRQMAQGLSWFKWGDSHYSRLSDHPRGPSLEFEDAVGMVQNEAGANLYTFMTTRYLYTATRSFQSAILLLKSPYGSVPVETLLRNVIIACTKAHYVLQPTKRESRESKLRQLYEADRAALDYAEVRELKLFGRAEPDEGTPQKPPQTIKEAKIIRDVLDVMVSRGNCTCGCKTCPEFDYERLRHRILRWWWQYSSVVHVNIWHIEKSFELAPSGQTYTTESVALAVHDLGWLYAQAVATFLERYELLDMIEPCRCTQVAMSQEQKPGI